MTKTIRIKDVITMNNGFFASMGREFPGVTPQQMDIYFFSNFGNKIISPLVENMLNIDGKLDAENLVTLSHAICAMHASQWEREERALSANYDLLNSYKMNRTDTLTIDTNLTRTGTDAVQEKAKVYGFDSTTGVDDSEHNSTNTKDLSDKNTGTESRVIEETGYTGTTPQKQVKAELEIALWDYLNSVLYTVSNDTTLQIY